MVIQVTCREITGHSREQLTSLVERALGPASEEQSEASRLLLDAFACFIAERVAVPNDIRLAVTAVMKRDNRLAA